MSQPSPESEANTLVMEIQSALSACRLKGGAFQRIAEERLVALLSLLSVTAGELKKARDAAAPLALNLNERHRRTAEGMSELYQMIRKAMGNPAVDVASALLFPGGTGFYTECAPNEQSDRIELLAQLLEAGMLARLPSEKAPHFAKQAREMAQSAREAADALRIPKARVSLLERSLALVNRGAKLELGNMQKRMLAEGISGEEVSALFSQKPKDRLA